MSLLAALTVAIASASVRPGETALGPPSGLEVNGIGGRDLPSTPFPVSLALVLSWTPAPPVVGKPAATGYEVQLVNETASFDPGVGWESGKVISNSTSCLLPASASSALRPEATFSWRVRALAAGGAPGTWSEAVSFDTAPQPSAWAQAQWIGGGSQLRADLEVKEGLTRARAYATGLGAFEMSINGEKVGDHVMDPGEAVYDQKTLFVGFNVTGMLKSGTNAIGALVGNSKWGYLDIYANRTALDDQSGDSTRAFRLLLTTEYADGSSSVFTSGTKEWVFRHGPIVYDHLWHGEIYDVRQETTGVAWNRAPLTAYDDGTWEPATLMNPRVGPLFPQLMAPIRVVETYQPAKTTVSSTTCSAPFLGGVAGEGESIYMECSEGVIDEIEFASYGTPLLAPAGNCSAMSKGACDAARSVEVVNGLCRGKSSCVVKADSTLFGGDPCFGKVKMLAIRGRGDASCKPVAPPPAAHANSTILYDFGRNMAGFATLTLSPQNREDAGTRGTNASVVMVRLKHTEIVNVDGVAYNNYYPGMEFNHSPTCNMSDWYERKWYECANQTDAVVIKLPLAAPISFTPTFTYHGFRFVELRVTEVLDDGSERPFGESLGSASMPFAAAMQAHRVHTDMRPISSISLGPGAGPAKVVGQVFNATMASHVSNVWGIPTDCPQREKRGWMGDAGISSSSLATFYDSLAFHGNFLRLIRDNQEKTCLVQPRTTIYGPCAASDHLNGSVPDVTPFATGPYGGNPGTTDWQVAYVIIAHSLLVHFGEKSVPLLQELWPGLDAFMGYLDGMADPLTGLLTKGARGDWIPPEGNRKGPFPTPTDTIASFFQTLCISHMADIARAIGDSAKAAWYSQRLAANRVAYHKAYFNGMGQATDGAKRCCYSLGSQTANMFALHIGAVPPEHVNATISMLNASIYNRFASQQAPTSADGATVWGPGAHVDSGIFGTTFVYETLQHYGYDTTAWDLVKQTTYPSLGYMVAQGATTLWEAWDGDRHTIGGGGTSRNHIMFGGGVNRFIAAGLGLTVPTLPGTLEPAHMGWRRVLVHPAPAMVRELRQGGATRRTPMGLAAVAWSIGQDRDTELSATVDVPEFTTADVRLPVLRVPVSAAVTVHLKIGNCTASAGRQHGTRLVFAGCNGAPVAAASVVVRPDGELVAAVELGPGSFSLHTSWTL